MKHSAKLLFFALALSLVLRHASSRNRPVPLTPSNRKTKYGNLGYYGFPYRDDFFVYPGERPPDCKETNDDADRTVKEVKADANVKKEKRGKNKMPDMDKSSSKADKAGIHYFGIDEENLLTYIYT